MKRRSSPAPYSARTVSAAARQLERHQRTRAALAATAEAQRKAAGAATQQASALSTAVDDASALVARARDLRASADLVREALERSKLLALNAGLEGARLGEPSGKVLVTLADEVRTVAARGLESLSDHLQLLTQVERERERLGSRVANAQSGVASLASDLVGLAEPHANAVRALDELEHDLRKTPGADPDAARAVAVAAEHAQALLTALTALSTRTRRNLLLDTLRPLLRRLIRLLESSDTEP